MPASGNGEASTLPDGLRGRSAKAARGHSRGSREVRPTDLGRQPIGSRRPCRRWPLAARGPAGGGRRASGRPELMARLAAGPCLLAGACVITTALARAHTGRFGGPGRWRPRHCTVRTMRQHMTVEMSPPRKRAIFLRRPRRFLRRPELSRSPPSCSRRARILMHSSGFLPAHAVARTAALAAHSEH